MAALAYVFGWPPGELLALTREELDFWLERANWCNENLKPR